MSITYNDLIARAQQVRDESEIGANTATRVGQLLADIIQWCQDNNADLGEYLLNFTAHLNERGGILNWFQSRIVLLKTMGSGYDDVSVGSLSDGDVYYDSQGNWIREKQGPEAINGIHPSKGVFYVNLANKTVYQWDGTTFQVAIESGGGGGASTVTAFEGYEVVASVGDLPEQGNPTTGYIVGTHIYAYVGTGGDTADGKYQDLGEVKGAAGSDGKSAFELAQQQGFQGTLADWLASLKGQDGADGNDGITGGVGNVTVYNNFNTAPAQGNDIDVTGATIGYEMYNDIADHEDRISELEENQEGGVEVSLSDDTLYIVTNPDLPWIRANRSAINYGDTLIGGNGKTVRLAITYKNLTSNIGVAVSGTGFSVVNNTQSIQVTSTGRATAYLDIKFLPASGTTAGAMTGTLTLTSGNAITTVALSGNAAVAVTPSLLVTPASLALSAMSGETDTGTIRIKGSNLEGNVSLAVTGSGIALSQNGTPVSSLSPDQYGELEETIIDVTYTAGSADVSETITVSSQGAESVSVGVTGTVVELPAEYTKLKFIQPASTGAYISTGVSVNKTKLNGNYKFKIVTSSKTAGSTLFFAGVAAANSANNDRARFVVDSNGARYCGPGNSSDFATLSKNSISEYFINGVSLGFCFEYGVANNNPYVKDASSENGATATSSTTTTNAGFSGDETITLFRCGSTYNTGQGIGLFQVYNGTTIVRDMVACKRNSDNVCGMYDKVNGVFYTSADQSKTFTGTAF